MAHEIELKLEVPAKAARRLPNAPWLQKLVSAPVKRRRIVSVYFDTRSARLRDSGITLRVRRAGDKTIQTVKRDPKGACGPFTREEWEYEIAGDEPDLKRAKETAMAQFNLKKLRRKLRPVFETDVARVAIPISFRGSDLALAIDRGQVRAGRKSKPISEIEIEVKNGEPIEVVKLARRIAAETAAGYSTKAKAERGYELSTGEQNRPVFPDDIILEVNMSAGEAFQAIGFSCLHHCAANQDAVIHGDSEGVHQMRVGLRRLRAAMSFFKELLEEPDTEVVKRELKWLTEQLGPARDLDVLVKESVVPLEQEQPETHEVAALESDLEDRRRAGFEQAKAAVGSDRYRKLVLDAALWLAAGAWITSSDALIATRREIPVADFAPGELSRRTDKVIKQSKKTGSLGTHQRHKLRIAIKKLRYACEFFASLYDGGKAARRRKRLSAVLKGLQSALGKLNDMRVHDKLAQHFAQPKPGATKKTEKAFAIGLLTGKEHAEAAALLSAAIKAGRKVTKTQPFWY
jgi:triphosphatase